MLFLSKGQTEKGTAAEQCQGRLRHLTWRVATIALNSVDHHLMMISSIVHHGLE